MTPRPSPWLSVIIPTYNGERFLGETLASVERQEDLRDLEILVFDDGSRDRTRDIVGSFQARLPIRFTALERSGNWVRSTNIGIRQARGEYISFLHQDDIWMPGRLARLRRAVERTTADLYLHDVLFVDSRGRPCGPWRCPLPSGVRLGPAEVLPRLMVQNFIGICAPLFRRSLAARLGSMDEALWYTADWDYWIRLAAGGASYHVDGALAGFRIHGASQTARRTVDLADMRRQLKGPMRRCARVLADLGGDDAVAHRAARLSLAVNLALAALAHRQRLPWRVLLPALFRSGPAVWRRFMVDSRIVERALARCRAREYGGEKGTGYAEGPEGATR